MNIKNVLKTTKDRQDKKINKMEQFNIRSQDKTKPPPPLLSSA